MQYNDDLEAGRPAFCFNYGRHAFEPRRIDVQNIGPCDGSPRGTNSALEFRNGIQFLTGHALHHDAE